MRPIWKLSILGVMAGLAACNGSTTTDSGPADTGPGDTGPADTGGGDATDVATDSNPMDTGPTDTGPTDTGPGDTGSDVVCPSDGGLQHPNGCTTFMDLSAPTATRTINFGGTAGLVYTPNCIRIAVGQQVTWSGMFSVHPLTPGIAPSRAAMCDTPGDTPSPIIADNSASATTVTYTFTARGVYPFYCMFHESFGMYGAVLVQ